MLNVTNRQIKKIWKVEQCLTQICLFLSIFHLDSFKYMYPGRLYNTLKICCTLKKKLFTVLHNFMILESMDSGLLVIWQSTLSFEDQWSLHLVHISLRAIITCSYLVICCLISNLFGKAQAEPSIGFSLPNKSDIRQAVDQTTILLFQTRQCLNFSSLKEIWMALITWCDVQSPWMPYIKNYVAHVVPP